MSKPSSQFRWLRYWFVLTMAAVGAGAAIVTGRGFLGSSGSFSHWLGGFMILGGCLALAKPLAASRSLIVSWHIDDDQLECRCLGRLWSVRLPLRDVTNLLKWETHTKVIGYKVQGYRFPEIWIDNLYLSDAANLVQLLSLRIPQSRKELSGDLKHDAFMRALLVRGLIFVCFAGTLVFGISVNRAGLHPPAQFGQPTAAFIAGSALVGVGAMGILCCLRGVSPPLIQVTVAGDSIQLSWLAWPSSNVRHSSEVMEIRTLRAATRPVGVPSDQFQIRFADGLTVTLHEATLSNARQLAEMICHLAPKVKIEDRSDPSLPARVPLPRVDLGPAKELHPYLEKGEQLLWAGRPVPEKLGSELSSAGLIGGMLMLFSAIAGIVCALIAPRGTLCVALPVLVLYFWAGVYVTTYRGGQHRRLLGSLYAVTDRRALVIGGLGWHGDTFTPHDVYYSLLPDDIRQYQVERQGRDIVLTTEWHVVHSRRHSHEALVQIGFIAVDDSAGAVAALQRLINPSASTLSADSAAGSAPRRPIRDGGIRG